MNKDEASKLYLKLNKIHKDLIYVRYSVLGESVYDNIDSATKTIKNVLENLKEVIEK